MSTLRARLEELAASGGRPLGELLRRHVVEGLLRRVARSARAGSLVLRGGLLTRMWVGPALRASQDGDFLALFDPEPEEAERRLREVLAGPADDGVQFDPESLLVEVIWRETPFPGMRAFVQAECAGEFFNVQADLGFGDPLVPPAGWVDYPTLLTGPARLLACRPETLVGWKLHGLFEHGVRRWRPKDLYDLHLLTAHVPLHADDLVEAIRGAFASRSAPLEDIPAVVYSRAWWGQEKNVAKWRKFCADPPADHPPGDLLSVAAEVARALCPAVGRLVALPDDWPGGSPGGVR
jgi:hypothetical protein